ncbi:hypothetical protein AB833_32420 [Chromatiales bacterium (ex Bugula neritina AB1)]|nr:hypothetical protein AB833_32420 [Chromatiales bacterium (ex Bugula neritina AB1)]
MGIAAITFDLDDTLWPCAPVISHAESVYMQWLAEHCPAALAEHEEESLRAIRHAMLDRRPELASDVSEWRRQATRELLQRYGGDEALAEAGFQAFYQARQGVTFYDEVLSSLQDLSFHYRLGSITNGNADLAEIGVDHLFDSALYATLELPAKPARGIFLRACEELGVSPQAVLHVGDNAYTDVEGARQAGCRTAWINRGGLVYPDDIDPADINITNLTELLALAPAIVRPA